MYKFCLLYMDFQVVVFLACVARDIPMSLLKQENTSEIPSLLQTIIVKIRTKKNIKYACI